MTAPPRTLVGLAFRRHFSPFRMFVDRQTRTVVVLNPKVGSRNVRHVLAAALMDARGLSDASGGRYRAFRKAREFPFARVRDYINVLARPDDYAFYCFVRNPYMRLKSAWVDKIAVGETEGFRRSAPGYVPALRRFARSHALPGGVDDAIPFATFVAFVASEEDGRRDKHWDLQMEVLFTDAIPYRQVFHIETEFAAGMRAILGRLDALNGRTEMLLATRRGAGPAHEAPVYDEPLAARVYAVYARDFEAFSYQPESWQGL